MDDYYFIEGLSGV